MEKEVLSQEEARARGYIPLSEASKETGEDRTTLWRKVDRGELPGVKALKGSRKIDYVLASAVGLGISAKKEKDYRELVETWIKGMKLGIYSNRNVPASSNYADGILRYGLDKYWKILGEKPSIAGVNVENFLRVMASDELQVDKEARRDHYAVKSHIYKACTRFTAFLITEGLKTEADLNAYRKHRPGSRFKPKRRALSEEEVREAIEYNRSWRTSRSQYNIELLDMLLHLYAYTGVRLEAAAGIRIRDINLEKKVMLAMDKGCKERWIPLHLFPEAQLVPKLRNWIDNIRPKSDSDLLLVHPDGTALSKDYIEKRIRFLKNSINSKKAYQALVRQQTGDFDPRQLMRQARKVALTMEGVRAHDLRRFFVTTLIKRGWPVPMVMELAGHSDVKTTMGYTLISLQDIMAQADSAYGNSPSNEGEKEDVLLEDEPFDRREAIRRMLAEA